MKQRDKAILIKMMEYCVEIKDTHDYFKQDKDLFMNEKRGFIYRNSITMPILQIGELAKMLSGEFLSEYTTIPMENDYADEGYCCTSLWESGLWNRVEYIRVRHSGTISGNRRDVENVSRMFGFTVKTEYCSCMKNRMQRP